MSTATGEGNKVSKATFLDFVREFSRSPRVRRIPVSTANIIFAAVDKDKSDYLDRVEFCHICGVMQYDFWTTTKYAPVKDWFPELWESSWFTSWREFVENGTFDTMMNGVLMLNLVLVVVETSFDLGGGEEPKILEDLELWFSFVYVVEVLLKLSIWSFPEYWSATSNKFDFFTTWLLLASSVADEVLVTDDPWTSTTLGPSTAGPAVTSELKRYMNILRLLRLLRVMKQLRRFPAVTLMVETIYRLVLASTDILTLLGVVIFFFTTLSVQLWGGLLYETNPKLEGLAYTEAKHFVLNFNDVPMAFGVWVVSLLCEYVPEFFDAIQKAAKHPWTALVFPIFYLMGVSVVFELVLAFTIDVFLNLKKKPLSDKHFGAIEELREVFEHDGKSLHYRLVGDESMQDKIVEVLEHMD
eukprot:CAMPEP_0117538774 /NCGR_PEP_ID=MMETSP0784-20121206/42650_1 /TAXON_ID=39447 /ORGANISM="" /LENGTH=412 /DNA_ID=CAMNT_0005335395 /DNA_START=526 /DNA_END=1764 /DNA_ORIENTATION=-